MTDAEKRDARETAKDQQIAELLAFKQNTERETMIRNLADEVGLDAKFLKFVVTDGDEDTVRTNMSDLLDALSESGTHTKQAPKPKAPRESDKDEANFLRPGGGGPDDDDSDDAIAASILEEIRKDRKNGGLTTRR